MSETGPRNPIIVIPSRLAAARLPEKPLAPIAIDEQGKHAYGTVWVGGSSMGTCSDWTTSSYDATAQTADTSDTENWRGNGRAYCDEKNHLYCFED